MNLFDALMRDLPRGDSTKTLLQQRMPQARWMPLSEMAAHKDLVYDPRKPGRRILVGALGSQLIGIDDPRHILTVAGSRAGKSVGLIGNLHFYPGSVLAADPKGELARVTAARRAALGQRVAVLDPFNTVPECAAYRASYNPMDILALDSATLLEDAALIAEAIVEQASDQRDPHWDESAKNFIEGVIVHVATADLHAHRISLVTVRDLIKRALFSDEPVRPHVRPTPVLFKEMLRNGESLEADPEMAAIGSAIIGAAYDFYGKGENELAGVLSTVNRHTRFLDYPAFRDIMQRSDFRLEDLKRLPGGLSVYLCFPAMRIELSKRWIRIFINQMLNAMERERTVPAAPVLACLDEFAALGYMKALEVAAGLVASFDVKLWVFLQDWNQGEALYGKRWETFAGNAGILQFFGNNDLVTASYVSRRLGKTPVQISREGDVAPDQRAQGVLGRSSTIELHDLLTPDEVMRQFARDDPQKRQLILWAGRHPMLMQRVMYYEKGGPLARFL